MLLYRDTCRGKCKHDSKNKGNRVESTTGIADATRTRPSWLLPSSLQSSWVQRQPSLPWSQLPEETGDQHDGTIKSSQARRTFFAAGVLLVVDLEMTAAFFAAPVLVVDFFAGAAFGVAADFLGAAAAFLAGAAFAGAAGFFAVVAFFAGVVAAFLAGAAAAFLAGALVAALVAALTGAF